MDRWGYIDVTWDLGWTVVRSTQTLDFSWLPKQFPPGVEIEIEERNAPEGHTMWRYVIRLRKQTRVQSLGAESYPDASVVAWFIMNYLCLNGWEPFQARPEVGPNPNRGGFFLKRQLPVSGN